METAIMQDEVYLARTANEFVKSIRWIASLSNGETIFEDHKPGERASWERLGEYIRLNKLKITRLRFQMGNLEVPLPPHAYAYVQKKKAISTGAWSLIQHCIGHIESNGMALIHYVADDHSSVSQIEPDPGPPFTIYPHDGPCDRSCCNAPSKTE